jgi:hypothetical protein
VTDLYMTVQGQSEDTTKAIAKSDAHLGVASDKEWLEGYEPKFVDFPFTNPNADFETHLEVVRRVKPELTVAPDIERGRGVDDVLHQAGLLDDYADSVVIVPKDCHPSVVPDRYRVGLPLGNFGSGAPWTVWDYRNCPQVHVLGGSPRHQLEAARCLRVVSCDTATLGKRARFGMWDGVSCDAPETWEYRRRLKESLDNYAEVLS